MTFEITKGDIVKLNNGKEVKVVNLPTSFMSNGSYEVIEWINNGVGGIGKTFWVKPDNVSYKIDPRFVDDVNNYFEVIWDEYGLNLIPKGLLDLSIESDREDFNRIEFNFGNGRKHKTINIHVGDVVINDMNKITTRPKRKSKSKIEKVINIIKGEENED